LRDGFSQGLHFFNEFGFLKDFDSFFATEDVLKLLELKKHIAVITHQLLEELPTFVMQI
jgi:hypothetical protein